MVLAYLFIRTALGLNIFLHGFVRIKSNYRQFIDGIIKEYDGTFLNGKLVSLFALMLPYLESMIGILLVAGLFTEISMVSGFFLLLLLLFGKAVKQDWLTVSLQMIYALFYGIVAAFIQYNTISLDNFLFK